MADHDPAQLSAVRTPTLMLRGSDSPDWIVADTDAVAALLPDVRVTILEGQQHLAHYQVPDVLAEHIVAFLTD